MTDTDFIQRAEYTSRHDELVQRVVKVEALLEAYRENVNVKFDKLTDKLDTTEKLLSSQLGTLKDEIYRQRLANFRWAMGIIISFVTGGGGLLGALQLFHLLK